MLHIERKSNEKRSYDCSAMLDCESGDHPRFTSPNHLNELFIRISGGVIRVQGEKLQAWETQEFYECYKDSTFDRDWETLTLTFTK